MGKFQINDSIQGYCLDCKKDITFLATSIKHMKGNGKKFEIYLGECPLCLVESIHLIVSL